jgi:hypothetical protein
MAVHHTTAMGSWCGWWRPGARYPWSKLATGDSFDECLTALLDALETVKGGDSLILAAGLHPDRQPLTRRRRF